MAETAALLQARLERLRKAIQTGALRVEHDGQSTWFRNLAEMLEIERQLQNEIAALSDTTTRRVRTVRFHSRSGW